MSSKRRKSPSEWQALIAEQEASGLSVAAFCLAHGLVDKTFYNQRRKLGFESKGSVSIDFLEFF